jgi:hypothetical protein
MMTLRPWSFASLLTMWVICGSSTAGAEPACTWALKAGETLRYRLSVKNDAEVRSSGVVDAVPKKSGVTLSLTLSWLVKRVAEDGTAEVTQTIEHARLSMYREYAKREESLYDSGDPNTVDNAWSGMMAAAIGPLLRAPYTLKISPRGRLSDVKLPEKAVTVWKELRVGLDDEKHAFSPLFSASGFIALLAPVLPGQSNKASAGNPWSYSWGNPKRSIQLTDTFTEGKSEGRSLKYLGKTEAVLTDLTEPPIIAPPPLSYPMTLVWQDKSVQFKNGRFEKQSGTATLTFDSGAGHLVEFTRDLTYRMAIDLWVGEDTRRSGTVTGSFHLTAGLALLPSKP